VFLQTTLGSDSEPGQGAAGDNAKLSYKVPWKGNIMNLDSKQKQWLLYLLYHSQMPCSESETMNDTKIFLYLVKKTILQDFEIFACTTLSHLPWTDHWQAVE